MLVFVDDFSTPGFCQCGHTCHDTSPRWDYISKDLDFSTNLAKHNVLMVFVYNLQDIQPPYQPVKDLVHSAITATSDLLILSSFKNTNVIVAIAAFP